MTGTEVASLSHSEGSMGSNAAASKFEEHILGMRDRIDQQLPINEENNVKNYKFLNMAAVIAQPGGCEMYLRLKE